MKCRGYHVCLCTPACCPESPGPSPSTAFRWRGLFWICSFLGAKPPKKFLGSKGHSSFSFTDNTAAILSPARLPQARFPPAPHSLITNPCLPTRSLPPGNSTYFIHIIYCTQSVILQSNCYYICFTNMLAREIDQRDRETCQIALFVNFGIFTLSQYTHLHCRLIFYCQQNYARYLVFSYGIEFMSFLKHLTYYRKTDVSLNFLHQHNYGGLFVQCNLLLLTFCYSRSTFMFMLAHFLKMRWDTEVAGGYYVIKNCLNV